MRLCLYGLLFFVTGAGAQDAFLAGWGAGRAANPAGLRFEISLPDDKSVWRQGELIPVALELSSSTPNVWRTNVLTYSRASLRNGMDEFHVDPASEAEDPLGRLPGGAGFVGVSGGPAPLSEAPYVVTQDLNEWVNFLRPGAYRLYVKTRRVSDVPRSASTRGAPIELTSNLLTLQVQEPSAAWTDAKLREAVTALDAKPAPDGADSYSRAGRILRYLRTKGAAAEMVRRLADGVEFPVHDFRLGLLSTPHREAALTWMEERLTAPEQAVNTLYVHTLSDLHMLVRLPLSTSPESGEDRRREEINQRERRRSVRERDYYLELEASLPEKTPRARAAGANAVARYSHGRTDEGPDAWRAAARILQWGLLNLPRTEQRGLLSSRWREIEGQEMLPALRRLAEDSSPAADREVRNLAMRRLYELDPADGRRRVLEQIRAPTLGFEWKTLAMLEERFLPELNEALALQLEAGQNVDRMILRYADGSIAERVREALAQRRAAEARQTLPPGCLSPLDFYLGLNSSAPSAQAPGSHSATDETFGNGEMGFGRRIPPPSVAAATSAARRTEPPATSRRKLRAAGS